MKTASKNNQEHKNATDEQMSTKLAFQALFVSPARAHSLAGLLEAT